jgi:hypothetical protein
MMFFAFSLGMVLSNLLSQNKVEAKKPVAEILFTYKGVDKTIENLSPAKREELEQLAAKRYKVLERAALEQYLHDFAASEKLDIAQAGNKLFKLEEPSKQEVNDFFTKHADQIKKPFFEIEADIKKQLTMQMAQRAKKEAITSLMAKGDLVILPKY